MQPAIYRCIHAKNNADLDRHGWHRCLKPGHVSSHWMRTIPSLCRWGRNCGEEGQLASIFLLSGTADPKKSYHLQMRHVEKSPSLEAPIRYPYSNTQHGSRASIHRGLCQCLGSARTASMRMSNFGPAQKDWWDGLALWIWRPSHSTP